MADLAFTRRSAAAVCGATLSFDDALSLMIKSVVPLDEERVALEEAGGRVLSRAVAAAAASPTCDLAAMDGYAIRDVAAGAGSVILQVVGQAAPAAAYPYRLAHGEAVRIFTGAPTPEGTDRIVPQELVTRWGDQVAVPTSPGQARHVRARGSDFAGGAVLLSARRLLDPRAILVAGAADAPKLWVIRKPRVFVLATGDEIRSAGSASMKPHAIPDSVSPAIAALARAWGADITGTSLVTDQPNAIECAACDAIRCVDVLVMVGGASVGDRDFSKSALRTLGLDLVFENVAIKPGKPVWYGRIGATHILGLPGNPTAAMVTARLLMAPLLCALQGRKPEAALRWRAMSLDAPLAATGAREAFLCGSEDDAGVHAIDRQFASGQASLAVADVLIRSPMNAPPKMAGTSVKVLDF